MTKEKFSFITQLGAVPAEGLARIPILVTGRWVKGGREVSFTRAELSQAVKNFQKLANHDLNVDYDHACEDLDRAAGEPTPSAGRILALDEPEPFRPDDQVTTGPGEQGNQLADQPSAGSDGRWILYGRYEPTDRARRLIKNREYRYVSAAFAKDYPDRKTGESQGLTLTSVALTNQPFLDELPEVWLSMNHQEIGGSGDQVKGEEAPSPDCRIKEAPDTRNRLSAEQGGKMAKLTLKCSAEGTHDAYDGDRKVGEIANDHLCDYTAKHASRQGAAATGGLSARNAGSTTLSADAYAAFAREVGAEGRSKEEIRGLVTLALNPPKDEVTLLAATIGADGRLDNTQLDALDDSGRISRSAWRQAKEAEQRVQNAFNRGQLTPAMVATGAPLRLALSDSAAFKALVEDRAALLKPNSVVGLGGSGAETGESPRQTFSRMVDEKKLRLMQADVRLNELEATRNASALVAKENPDLLKNYRADAKSA